MRSIQNYGTQEQAYSVRTPFSSTSSEVQVFIFGLRIHYNPQLYYVSAIDDS
jgi:hypothetical protein